MLQLLHKRPVSKWLVIFLDIKMKSMDLQCNSIVLAILPAQSGITQAASSRLLPAKGPRLLYPCACRPVSTNANKIDKLV